MNELLRFLSCLSAFLGALTLIQSRSGKVNTLLWAPKLWAAALSPFVAIMGVGGVLCGVVRRDRKATFAGLVGAVLSARYVARVTAKHFGFDDAFGADWPSRIPPELRPRMLPKRWTLNREDPPQVLWQQDVVFGIHLETGEPLLADIWQPPQEVPRTGLAVIYFHGSGWNYADKDFGTRYFFRHLAGQGHVVMDVAYTLAPMATLHAMMADVKRAIAWMKNNSAAFAVDPDRIVLMGGSAGGQLALLAAYTPNHPELDPSDVSTDTTVRAVVSYYGPPDLRALHNHFLTMLPLTGESWLERKYIAFLDQCVGLELIPMADLIPNFLGGTPDEVPKHYFLASPINHVGQHCPPTLLLQGAHDFAGMAPYVRRLHSALRNAGVTSIYLEFSETEHGFDLFLPKWSPAAQAATYDVERFLALMA